VSVVSQGDRLERERAGLAEGEGDPAWELLVELVRRRGLRFVVEGEGGEEEGSGVEDLDWAQRKARELAREYGGCRAAYILRVTYGLKPREIAVLLGANHATVRNCISYYRKRDRRAELEVPPLRAFRRHRELCERDPYSLECQLLEAEMFMFNVARRAAPATMFWDLMLRAASIHRLVFPEVYALLQAYAVAAGTDFRKLLRAQRGGGVWAVGDGVAAYTYVVLELAHHMLGLRSYRYSERLREAIGELTGKPEKDPLGRSMTPLTLQIALTVNATVSRLGSKLLAKERQLLRELKEALGKPKGKS
jgi:hypothetical protein